MSLTSLQTPRRAVLLVEDLVPVREILAACVSRVPDFAVVGVAGSVAEAREAIIRLQPDVVVLDWMLPDGTGADLLRSLPEPIRPRVLIFSAHASQEVESEAVAAGAVGVTDKVIRFSQFVAKLRTVASFPAAPTRAEADAFRRLVGMGGAAGTHLVPETALSSIAS